MDSVWQIFGKWLMIGAVLLLPSWVVAADKPSRSHEEMLPIAVREIPAVQAVPSPGKPDDPNACFAQACSLLESRFSLPPGSLAKELPGFAQKLLDDKDTPALERAGALFVMGKYVEAEAQHREVVAVLEKVRGDDHSDTVRARQNLERMLKSQGNSKPTPPKPTPTKADIQYGSHPHQILDLYLPTQGTGKFPVVLWFGGLWAPSKHAPVEKFLPKGCAAVAVEMRTMGDAIKDNISPPVSVCLLNARRAVQFVRLHASEWSLDPTRIAVGGGSQGALPALYVGCAGEKADPGSSDPVERVSTRVTCVGAWRSQPSIDPKQMQEWVPGVEWGVPAWGCSFAESLKKREELLPLISKWSPEALVGKDAPPIYFEYDWGLTKPDDVKEMNYLVHSPRWGLGFQKTAQERGATCYLGFPGHPSEKFLDMWDFMVRELGAGSARKAVPGKVAR